MAKVESCPKTTVASSVETVEPLVRLFGVLLFCFFAYSAQAFVLPSSVGFSQSFDNDKNRYSALNFSLATPIQAMVHGGISLSNLQFDENNSGENRFYSLGIQSNPLRDWVFSGDFSYIEVSDQMRIANPSATVQSYFRRVNFRLEVGYRMIETEVTPALGTFVQSFGDLIRDENFWWDLSAQLDPTENIVIGLNYRQYQYSTRFDFFTTALAQPLGYSLATINFGASFADFIYSINGTFYRNRWDFSLDYTLIENEFEDSRTSIWTPSVGFRLNQKWFFNMSVGLSRGVTSGEEDRTGGFLSLGTTYSF